VKRLAKFAASTNAQARYLLPFLTLPSPFFLRLLYLVRQALLRHNVIGIVDNRDNAVVGMQIDSAVHHLRLLMVKSDSMIANSL
jgi:hypothetical protein